MDNLKTLAYRCLLMLSLFATVLFTLFIFAILHENYQIGYMGTPFDQPITVTGAEWVRVQEIQKFQPVIRVTRTNEVPNDAFDIGDPDHDWVGYHVNRWERDGDLRTSGAPQQERRWPDLNFVPDKDQFIGARRAGERYELLVVHFTTPEVKTFDYTAPDERTWLSFEPGRPYTVKLNRKGDIFWETLTPIEEK